VRGDFRYYLNLSTKISWEISFMTRTVSKVVTDFTLSVLLRHPGELGGLYWSFTMVQNQIFCFVSIYLYKRFAHWGSKTITTDVGDVEVEGGTINSDYDIPSGCNSTVTVIFDGSKITEIICPGNVLDEVLPIVVVVLFVFSIIGFISFLLSINMQYLRTFTDIRTGKQSVCDNWTDVTTDRERFRVFSKHKSYYKSINKEIKVWLNENWGKWEVQKEDWFTPEIINKIPVELLPAEALKKKYGVRKTVRGANTIRVGKVLKVDRGSAVMSTGCRVVGLSAVKADEGGAITSSRRKKTMMVSPKMKG